MMNEVQSRSHRLAVLIDADNANAELIEPLLKEISKYGTAHVKRIYGDWTSPQLNKWKDKLNKHAIQPIQQFGYTTGKNSTDSALIIDAMDLLYTENFDGFCIVSSDSDFTRLASRIRESGLVIYGFGERKTPEPFISACDKFIYTEILKQEDTILATSENLLKEVNKANSDKNQAQKTEAAKAQKLRSNKKLIKLLRDACEAVTEDEEWIHLGQLGSQLTKISPDFDSRNYGYTKLSSLVEAIDIFQIKKTSKIVYVKLKN